MDSNTKLTFLGGNDQGLVPGAQGQCQAYVVFLLHSADMARDCKKSNGMRVDSRVAEFVNTDPGGVGQSGLRRKGAVTQPDPTDYCGLLGGQGTYTDN